MQFPAVLVYVEVVVAQDGHSHESIEVTRLGQ